MGISKDEFSSLKKKYNLVPLWMDLSTDIITPLGAFLSLADNHQPSYLLESVEREESIARFSFLGVGALESIVISGRDPRGCLNEVFRRYRVPPLDGVFPFEGGFIGYLSYDLVRFFEPVDVKVQGDYPEAMFFLPEVQIAFDHKEQRMRVLLWMKAEYSDYEQGMNRLYEILGRMGRSSQREFFDYSVLESARREVRGTLKGVNSNFTKRRFLQAVERAKHHIYNGDVVQVVLSQRFEMEAKVHPFLVYRILRLLNPSPYMFYLSFPNQHLRLVGSSPEMLVRLKDGVIETHPIAGTRRRGRNREEDLILAKDLLSDEKERAEHVMLVDLGRNDIGRVSELGTVRVEEFMHIENFSHVMHIVSRVSGRLKPGLSALDVLSSTFPAGTVSGAPKIRAMEIISNLEPTPRGIYAGGIGYFDFSGNMDICIAIRTILFYNNKSFVQAGAGIVADSVSELEYKETLNKARAQILAIRLAEKIGGRGIYGKDKIAKAR